jgi:hypothetical protein
MTALRGWCTSPSATANPPFPSRQAQLESGVRGNVPAPFGAGERLQSPTYRYPTCSVEVEVRSVPYENIPCGRRAGCCIFTYQTGAIIDLKRYFYSP